MTADYGTYSNKWWIIIPFSAAALLGGSALLWPPLPLWMRITLGALAAMVGALGVLGVSMARFGNDDDLKKAFRDALLVRIRWNGDGRALDIGTGSGLVAIGLARHFEDAEVLGCDTWTGGFVGLTQELCERNAQAEGVGERVRFEEADARALVYNDEEFDAVVSKDVFHAIQTESDKLVLFREALRVLRSGGAFAFIDPYGIKSVYPDVGAFVVALRAEGLTSVHFAWLDEVGRIPRLLRPIVGRPGIVYGVK